MAYQINAGYGHTNELKICVPWNGKDIVFGCVVCIDEESISVEENIPFEHLSLLG